eukprot:g29548.t1
MADFMEQVQTLLKNLSGELFLVGGAFVLQFFLFGNVLWPWRKKAKGKASKKLDPSTPTRQEVDHILEATTAAFEQGDHRTVLRKPVLAHGIWGNRSSCKMTSGTCANFGAGGGVYAKTQEGPNLHSRRGEALQCYAELPELPKHVATQLVEIACRDRRLDEVLPKLESLQIPMTTDSLNLMLNESIRSGQPEVAKKALELAQQQQVEKNSRTYSLLVRSEKDAKEVRRLLEEVDAMMSQAVLEVCTKTGDVQLAERLSEMLKPEEGNQAPAFMALMRFYVEAGRPEKALELYDTLTEKKETLQTGRGEEG